LHLVAKWSPRYGADTVQLHREVVDARGEVWWGVIGSTERKKLSDENLERLRTQLAAGVETKVFIAGPATSPVVETRLTDIQTTRPPDEELIPSYYPSALHHSLWLKLSDFSELSQVELLGMLEPNAEPGRIVTLTNQANPLLVRIRSTPRV